MTKMTHCGWCRRPIEAQSGRGRPKQFCSQKCRQWNWVAQNRARELELGEGELVMARKELDLLHDALYVLACAVDDTQRDLDDNPDDPQELRRMLSWLLESAKPLRDYEMSAPGAFSQ
ncbi:MAG TPA: hypothetical protein DCY63_07290 [Acidimicrobiaceae bacterium]|nr:hypothetical protein [Acidimicrobiaceae bacterium]